MKKFFKRFIRFKNPIAKLLLACSFVFSCVLLGSWTEYDDDDGSLGNNILSELAYYINIDSGMDTEILDANKYLNYYDVQNARVTTLDIIFDDEFYYNDYGISNVEFPLFIGYLTNFDYQLNVSSSYIVYDNNNTNYTAYFNSFLNDYYQDYLTSYYLNTIDLAFDDYINYSILSIHLEGSISQNSLHNFYSSFYVGVVSPADDIKIVNGSNFIEFDVYNDLLSDYNYLNTQYTNLQSQYNTLNTNYQNLQSQYNTLNTNYLDLLTDYSILHGQYGSLESDYNLLQSNYNSYVSSHSYTNSDYNTLNTNYQNLQSQYNTYVDNHTYTNSQYNTLSTNYQNLQSQYNTLYNDYGSLNNSYTNLSNDYSALQSQYSSLSNEYQDYVSSHSYTNTEYNYLLNNFNNAYDIGYNDALDRSSQVVASNYHIWIASQNGSQTQYDFTKVTELDSSFYIDEQGFLDVSSIYSSYITGNNNVILVELDNPVNVINYDLLFNSIATGNQTNIMPHFVNFSTPYTPLYLCVNSTQYVDEQLSLMNFIKYQDSSVTNIMNYQYDAFAIIYLNSENVLSNIKLNGLGDYNLGYLNGLEQNNLDFQELKDDYATLESDYDGLNTRFEALQQQYNTLSNSATELNLRNLFWYIASTPFESFKSIWNVDFLGLNIASFFMGLFSVFIIIWILRKIF